MPSPADIITVTFGGKTFHCSRRTHAHLLWTQERLTAAEPLARLVVIQGCYNTGVKASAGTHDYDAVLDVAITGGMDWRSAEQFLRLCGWAAWWRKPPTFSHHIHMISLGYPGQVGVYVPGQVRDYYAFRSGLKGHTPDHTWHPADIDSTIFDYDAWEDRMSPEDRKFITDRFTTLEAKIDAVPAKTWAHKIKVGKDGFRSAGELLNNLFKGVTK